MVETFQLTPEAIAPADVRRPIGDWLRRHGVEPRDVPSTNTLSVEHDTASIWAWYTDGEGYVLDESDERAQQRVEFPLTEPFPRRVAQHLHDHASGRGVRS